ncbi:conserved hypothetical protein [Candida dubliniensis CD36]|uniref:Uncharacterized protein n=1 Tax=Candida dubliniensis (strain CD36 / ATCC MYA-646 / CBS 7987 / NCPF 3949 / NRRL Y-17841) TaxID=573826 RepID=B9WBW9_CANDC|nr:conserved hypothetical protein [Candida dubliniensis CD36]CAX43891.1 conserved hypothetical protein [Candida dubliniensis CD36]
MVTINYEPLEHLPHIDENISPEERSHVEQLIRLELANQFNNNIQHITHNDQVMANPNILLEQQQQQPQQQQQQQQEPLVPTPMHPLVDQLLPLNQNIQPTSIMQLTQERFEEEFGDEDDYDEDDDDDKHLPPGIDLTKYTQFNITSPLDEEENSSILDNNNQQINYTNLYTTLGHSALQHRNLELLLRNQNDLNQLQQQDLARLEELNNELTKNINNKRSMVDELITNRKRRQLNDLKPLQEEYEQCWKQSINTAIESSINSMNQK